MKREVAKDRLFGFVEPGLSMKRVSFEVCVDEIFDDFEAELKKRAENETEIATICYMQGSDSRDAELRELKAELTKQKKWGMRRRDDAHKFNKENQALKSELEKHSAEMVVKYEAHGLNTEVYFEDSQCNQHEIVLDEDTNLKTYEVLILQKEMF